MRYEVKLLGEAFLHSELRSILRRHATGLRTAFPSRTVSSLYLDTAEGRAVEENLAGISHREKIRFRWYGTDVRGVHGQLERKVRHNLLGWKDHATIDAALDVEGARRRDFLNALRSGVSAEWREDLAPLEVVQWIAYEREYLATRDGRLRVTLDRDLRAFDQRDRIRLSSRWPTPTPEVVVIELKAKLADARLVEDLLQSVPVVVDKCSKFVLASAPEDGPLRAVAPL